jgi:hypothetical protein
MEFFPCTQKYVSVDVHQTESVRGSDVHRSLQNLGRHYAICFVAPIRGLELVTPRVVENLWIPNVRYVLLLFFL